MTATTKPPKPPKGYRIVHKPGQRTNDKPIDGDLVWDIDGWNSTANVGGIFGFDLYYCRPAKRGKRSKK